MLGGVAADSLRLVGILRSRVSQSLEAADGVLELVVVAGGGGGPGAAGGAIVPTCLDKGLRPTLSLT
jgi:hypothetical protein